MLFSSSSCSSRYKPRARLMAGFCVLGSLCGVAAFVAITLTRCPPLKIDGPLGSADVDADVDADVFGDCSAGCGCREVPYHPVCSRDGEAVFFSPCHAGCRLANDTEDSSGGGRRRRNLYWDCACVRRLSERTGRRPATPWWEEEEKEEGEGEGRPLPPPGDDVAVVDSAVDGYCPFDCDRAFYGLLGVLFVMALLGGATRIPNMLISLRVINPADKAAGLTLSVSLLSLLAFLPSPVIFGKLVDAACKLWGELAHIATSQPISLV